VGRVVGKNSIIPAKRAPVDLPDQRRSYGEGISVTGRQGNPEISIINPEAGVGRGLGQEREDWIDLTVGTARG